MSKTAFGKIAEGLREVLSIVRGKQKPARVHIPAPTSKPGKTGRSKIGRPRG